jgi:membrane fusion protein (multidrug efflux system)
MARKPIYTITAIAGIAVASAAAWWLQSRPQSAVAVTSINAEKASAPRDASSAPRVSGVEVAKVQAQPLRDDVQAVGSLRARHSVMLRPEVLGRVVSLGFQDGQGVRRGQVLVQLDDALQKAELQQAQAQLAIAQASYKRTQELVAANFVAQQTLETSAANLQVAQAQLALAQARLARMAILAPFDGTAGIRLVNVGDYVKDGADLIALEDTRAMMVDFRLPERVGGKVRVGQKVELTLDALPGRNFLAVVDAIEPLVDANGRSIGVRASLPNSGPRGDKPVAKPKLAGNTSAQAGTTGEPPPLRSGMFARATVVFSVNEAALVVPEEAIVPQGGRQFVIKVVAPGEVPDTAGKLAPEVQFVSKRQEVKLGVRRLGKVEITEGLTAADTVVVAGQQRLQKDGSPLRIVELGQPGGKPGGKPGPAASTPASSASR